MNWLVNRRLRLSADYDFTQQSGPGNATVVGNQVVNSPLNTGQQLGTPFGQQLNTLTTGNYNRNVLLFGVHLAL